MNPESFDVMAAKLELAKRYHVAELNAAIFADAAPGAFIAVRPIRWYQRAWWRVRGYVWTLWRALRGDELDTPNDDY